MKRKRITVICTLLCCAAFMASIAFSAMSSVVLAGTDDVVYGEGDLINPNFDPNTGSFYNPDSEGESVAPLNLNLPQQGVQMTLGAPATPTSAAPAAEAAENYRKETNIGYNQVSVQLDADTIMYSGQSARVNAYLSTSSIPNDVYFENVQVRVKLPEGATGVTSTLFAASEDPLIPAWMKASEMRPSVKGELIGTDYYAIFNFPILYNWNPSGGSSETRPFYFDYIPFPNGITPDGTNFTLSAQILIRDPDSAQPDPYVLVPVSGDLGNTVKQTAKAGFAWNNVNNTVNPASKTGITHNFDGKYTVSATYTVTTSPNYAPYTSTAGAIFADKVILTHVMTMPDGVTVQDGYVTATGNGNVVISDGGKTVTTTWTIANTSPKNAQNLPTADIGSVSRTVTLSFVDIDNSVFKEGMAVTVNSTASGSVTSAVTSAASPFDIKTKDAALALSKAVYVPDKEIFTLSEKLEKIILAPADKTQFFLDDVNAYEKNPPAKFKLSGFGNFQPAPSTSTLKNFTIEDTWTEGEFYFDSMTTGVYEGYTAGTYTIQYRTGTSTWTSFPGSPYSAATSSTIGPVSGKVITGVRLQFGEVSPGFKIKDSADENAPTVSLKPRTPSGTNGRTYTNNAKLTFNDIYNTLHTVTKSAVASYEKSGLPTIGSYKYAKNLTASDRTDYYPDDLVEYTLAVINTHATAPWQNPRITDHMSAYIDPATFQPQGFTVYSFDKNAAITDTYPINKSTGALAAGVSPVSGHSLAYQSGAPLPPTTTAANTNPQTSKSENTYDVTYNFTGNIEPGQLLLITYKVKIKSLRELNKTTAEALPVHNWFNAYHRPSASGGGPGDDVIRLGSDGYREIQVGGIVITLDARKQVSVNGGAWGSSVTAYPGDTLKFKLEVENYNDGKSYPNEAYRANFIVGDVLPVGFKYVQNSAKLQKGAGAETNLPNPAGADFYKAGTSSLGEQLLWDLGKTERGDVFTITFEATVGTAAEVGITGNTTYKDCKNFIGLFAYEYNNTTDRTKPIDSYMFRSGNKLTDSDTATASAANGRYNWDNIGADANSTSRLQNSVTITVNSQNAYASIAKTASTNSAKIGDTVTYTITVRNTGATGAKDIKNQVMIDLLPKGLEYVEGSMQYRANGTPAGTAADKSGFAPVVPETLSDGQTKLTVTLNAEATYTPGQYGVYRFEVKPGATCMDDVSAITKVFTNYAAFFQDIDAAITYTAGTKQDDATALSGLSNWYTEQGSWARIHASHDLTVTANTIMPGIQKTPYYINTQNQSIESSYLWESVSGKNLLPGSVMGWEIVVGNYTGATLPMFEPKIVDYLPPGVSYDENLPAKIYKKTISTGAKIAGTDETLAKPVYGNPGADALTTKEISWVLTGKTLNANEAYVIRFYTSLSSNYFGTARNRAYVVPNERVYADKIPSGWGSYKKTEAEIGGKDGVVIDASVNIYSELGAIGVKRATVKDAESGATLGPAQDLETISCTQGSSVTFDLITRNTGTKQFSSIVLIDKLPVVGDTGVHTATLPRKSEWALPLKSGFSASDVKVYKGTGDPVNAGRGTAITGFSLNFTNKTGTAEFSKTADWDSGNALGAEWSATAYDPAAHNTFRIALPSSVTLDNGEWILVQYEASVPKADGINGIAWNSFAFDAKYKNPLDQGATPVLMNPNEPLKVGILTDDLRFSKKTQGGVKDGGSSNVQIPFGADVTFLLDDVRNPKPSDVAPFTITDIPNFGRGGLELKSIEMPRFTKTGGAGTGVKYSISAITSAGATLSNGIKYDADQAQTIKAEDLLMGKNGDGSYVLGSAYITQLIIDFGTVPGGFVNSDKIKMTFTTVNKPAGTAYAAHTENGTEIPENTGVNTATLKVGNRSLTDYDEYKVFDLGLTIEKDTLKQDGTRATNVTDADSATGLPLNVLERGMWSDANGDLLTAFAINGVVKNDAPASATLVLTDMPRLLPTGQTPEAGLVPIRLELPNFVNAGTQSGAAGPSVDVKLHFAGDAANTFTTVKTGLTPWSNSADKVVDLDAINKSRKLVDQLVITFNNAPVGFAQDGDIKAAFAYVGDVTLMESLGSGKLSDWNRAWNDVVLTNTYGNGQTTPIASDYACVSASEAIAIEKLNESVGGKYQKDYQPGSDAKFELFNVENALNQSAKNFVLYDIPESYLKLKSVKLPAFVNAAGVSYKVYAYNGSEDLISALPTGRAASGFSWTTDEKSAINAWLNATASWSEVGSNNNAGVASGDIQLAGARAFKVVFSIVPKGFKQSGDAANPKGVAPVVVTCSISDDLSGFRNNGKGEYYANNEATLLYDGVVSKFGRGAQDTEEITITAQLGKLTIDKHTADKNGVKVKTDKSTANTDEAKMKDRELWSDAANGNALTGKFIIFDGVKNTTDLANVKLTLTDIPELIESDGAVKAGLVPTKLEIPAFDNPGSATYDVEYKLYNATAYALASVGSFEARGLSAGSNQTVTFPRVGADDYVKEILVTIKNAPKGFAQRADIVATFVMKGEAGSMNLMQRQPSWSGNWRYLKNKTNLVLQASGGLDPLVTEDKEDFVTLQADEKISVNKKARGSQAEYNKAFYEGGDTASFELSEIRNGYDSVAKKFRLYDIPATNLMLSELDMPAFDNAGTLKYTVYAYTGNASGIPAFAIPSYAGNAKNFHDFKTGGAFDANEQAAIDSWMNGSGWDSVGEYDAATAHKGIKLTLTGKTTLAFKIEFGDAPKGFAQKADPAVVRCEIASNVNVYTKSADAEDVYKAKNAVALMYDAIGTLSATDEDQIEMITYQLSVSLDKHAADKNGALAVKKSDANPQSDEQVKSRAVYEENSKNYAKFQINAIESTAPFTSTLTLNDRPLVKSAGGSVTSALIPVSFEMPAFDNAVKKDGTPVSYTVEVSEDNGLSYRTVTTVQDAGVAATVNFGSEAVTDIRVTFADVEKGFKQLTPIIAKFQFFADDYGKLEAIPGHSGWSRMWNEADLTLDCSKLEKIESGVEKDYASICLAEDIKLEKHLVPTVSAKPLESGDKALFELTNVANALPGMPAKNFQFYDIPQDNTLLLESVNMPAFLMGNGVSYDVYAYYGTVPGAARLPSSLSGHVPALKNGAITAAESTAINNWLNGTGWTLVNATPYNAASAQGAIELPKQGGKAPTAFKVKFYDANGEVPVGFGQDGSVGVTCLIGSDFTSYTKAGEGKYTAKNEAALLYDGPINHLGAWSEAVINVEDVDFAVTVTKKTDETSLPGKVTLFGGMAAFHITGVQNYVPGRPAALSVVDTPPAGLHLSKLIIPAFNNNNNETISWGAISGNYVPTKYSVSVQLTDGGNWTVLPGCDALDSSARQVVNVDFTKHVYAFKLDFGNVNMKYPDGSKDGVDQYVVPAGFEQQSAIIAEFYVDESKNMFSETQGGYSKATNKVELTNAYRALSRSANSSDYVLIEEPSDDIGKKAQQAVVGAGDTASFSITGIRNYLNRDATNFRFIDTPEKGLYLQRLVVPAFNAPRSPLFSTTFTVTANTIDGKTLVLADAGGRTTFASNVQNVITVPAANQTLATYVKDFTVSYADPVPPDFGQTAAITTTFLTDKDIAVHAPNNYTDTNKVELRFNNEVRQAQDSVKVFNPNVSIDIKKTSATPQVKAGDNAIFAIDGIENKLVVDANNFRLLDTPDEALYLRSIVMPKFKNAGNVKYSIYARLNSTDARIPWVTIRENLDANLTYNIVLSNLAETDRVAQLRIEFGTVPAGFKNDGFMSTTFATSKNRSLYLPGNITSNKVELSYSRYGVDLWGEARDITRVVFDTPVIDKTAGNITAVRGQEITYSIGSLTNETGAVMNNYAIDDIPQQGIEFRRTELPAFTLGSGVRYSVAYRTNLNSTWRLMASNLDAGYAQTVNAPQLQTGERITVIRVLFDSVPAGFGAGNSITHVFVVTAEPSWLETNTIGNQARYSYTTSNTPYGNTVVNNYYTNSTTTQEDVPYSFIQTPEEEVPYAPVQIKNPMAVTGEDGMAPMYWILVAIALVIGAGLVALSSAFADKKALGKR